MTKYRRPFSVDYRKPVVMDSSDPRYKNLERYRSRLGRKVIVKDLPKISSMSLRTYFWNFYFFEGFYDEFGNNIRVTGNLSSSIFLDSVPASINIEFLVSGAIESVDGPSFDRLDLYVNDIFVKRFNPTVDINGQPLQAYIVEERKETINIASYLNLGTNLIEFRWDTGDQQYQKFSGWFVKDIKINQRIQNWTPSGYVRQTTTPVLGAI